ncbi:MAG: menaquinone biosynthesis protein [Verrucomicrobia bacterium]|nr:menaquinone biosynthesis protein [Verrucomicrobiota bacterium]
MRGGRAVNNSDQPLPRLRLAEERGPEDLAQALGREKRAEQLAREDRLEKALGDFKVGSVPYLNAVPLTRGLEHEIVLLPPSELARQLRAGQLDAGLVSVTEVLFHPGFDVLDGIAIASLGEVKSVFLAHRVPRSEIKTVYCDPASLTSVRLLEVLFAEEGLRPALVPLPGYDQVSNLDAVLLIGDEAIRFLLSKPAHEIWDLGAAWYELTRLPFVYAVWALTRRRDTRELRRALREARDFGLETLDYLIASRPEFTLDFRKDYLGWHIHFHLGQDEKRGLARFIELLRKHQTVPVLDPVFVK